MIALWLALAAQAADPVADHVERYPLAAPVELPDTGVVRIAVPPALRTPADPADASDLLLVDANGEAVPVVRLDAAPTWDAQPVDARPTADPAVWRVDVGRRPVDGLRITLPRAPLAATVTVEDPGGAVVGGPTLLWRTHDDALTTLTTAPIDGELTVRVEAHGDGRRVVPEIEALRLRDPGVVDDVVRAPIASWLVQENGWARYDVVAPRLPVRAVRVDPVEDVLERRAAVTPIDLEVVPGALSPELSPIDTTPISRIRLGHVAVDDLTVPVNGSGDALALLVDADRKPPLGVTEVELVVPGLELVVADAGPGPHTLYAGASPGTSPRWDLAAAAPELAREAVGVVEPGPVTPNPAWVPPEVRANLVAPSAAVAVDRGWRHEVRGEGLVRIGLPDEVLAHARADLGDLRLVTADGRQVPYLLRRSGGERAWPDLPVERTERDGQSLLSVTLPHPDVPVSSVQLTTSAPLFDRTVIVSRPGGSRLVPVRTLRWIGEDRPSTLGVEIDLRVGGELVVGIDNGDDPPLPIDALEVRWPAWELIAALPDEPVALVYGDPRRDPPSYDLALLRDELRHRAVDVATLGAREAIEGPPLSMLDRALVACGVGVLVLGLVGLLLALLRAVPAADPA